jgi:hypothetical protein
LSPAVQWGTNHPAATWVAGKENIGWVFADRRPVVLIVEDELLLRINAAEMIADAGFEVVV